MLLFNVMIAKENGISNFPLITIIVQNVKHIIVIYVRIIILIINN